MLCLIIDLMFNRLNWRPLYQIFYLPCDLANGCQHVSLYHSTVLCCSASLGKGKGKVDHAPQERA